MKIPKILENIPLEVVNKQLVISICETFKLSNLTQNEEQIDTIFKIIDILKESNPEIKTIGQFAEEFDVDQFKQITQSIVGLKQQAFADSLVHVDSAGRCPYCSSIITVANLMKGGKNHESI